MVWPAFCLFPTNFYPREMTFTRRLGSDKSADFHRGKITLGKTIFLGFSSNPLGNLLVSRENGP
jgi:hypothetical protein